MTALTDYELIEHLSPDGWRGQVVCPVCPRPALVGPLATSIEQAVQIAREHENEVHSVRVGVS